MAESKIWFCKIGEVDPAYVPDGADLPMRKAVREAFTAITGKEAEFVFSGWGATLDEAERAVVENREPSPEHYADWLKREAAPELYEALKGAETLLTTLIIHEDHRDVVAELIRERTKIRAALLKAKENDDG